MSEVASEARPASSAGTPADGPVAYLLALLAGGIGAFLLFIGALAALDATGHLPPPALTNNLCLDEKLEDLRERHLGDRPTMLIVGSSVAWRHFDGDALHRRQPDAVPLNGGFCGLRLNQTEMSAEWLLGLYPTARQVVAIAAPTDFEDCVATPSALFDAADARAYVTREGWRWGFYLRYFSPVTLARNALTIAARRRNEDGKEPFFMTRWGDAPLPSSPHPDGLRYPAMAGLDGSCFVALRRMAQDVVASGRDFVLVLNPVHPEWMARYDRDGTLIARWQQLSRQAVAGTGARLWDAHAALNLPVPAFYDAIHLVWPAARCFTAKLLVATGTVGPETDLAPECPAATAPERQAALPG
jgi:hypothetical protein